VGRRVVGVMRVVVFMRIVVVRRVVVVGVGCRYGLLRYARTRSYRRRGMASGSSRGSLTVHG
jgi:hypothetical protein